MDPKSKLGTSLRPCDSFSASEKAALPSMARQNLGRAPRCNSPSYEFLRCTDALAEFWAGNDTNLSKQLCIALLLALGWMICLQYMCFNYQDIELVCKNSMHLVLARCLGHS